MSTKPRTKYQDQLTAHHEAGHAVAHVVLDLPFEYVTIEPDGEISAGHVAYTRPKEIVEAWNDGDRDSAVVRHYIERELITLLAGLEAQRRRFPRSARRMTDHLSEGFKLGGVTLKPGMEIASDGADYTKVGRIIGDLFGDVGDVGDVGVKYRQYIDARTRALIGDYWKAVERVAQALIERRRLDYDAVSRLVYPAMTIPPLPSDQTTI